MSTLLIHVLSDYLRDSAPAANMFGEAFRCAVLDDENTALTNYGCSPSQIAFLISRDRKTILDALSKEIGPVMDELDPSSGAILNYPGGSVRLREWKVLYNNGNNRTVMIRGDGLADPVTVKFVDGGGNAIAGNVVGKNCDKDVWQRMYVTAALPAGSYSVTVQSTSNGSHASSPPSNPLVVS
jgi:hypothetical protein